jgi:hypothetical protein
MPINENKMVANWQVESLRLSAFLAPSVRVKDENWWARITGSEAETKTIKTTRGEIAEAGTFEDNLLSLSVQPGRVDWFLTPHQSKIENSEIHIKSVGRFPNVLDGFIRGMEQWLSISPAVVRLAYGAVLLEPVDTKEVGYRRLSEYLKTMRVDEASQDFFFQINRPRRRGQKRDGLLLNRLSKWSVASFQPFSMAVALGSPPVFSSTLVHLPTDSVTYAVRLELDLSTPPQYQEELVHDELPSIFRELVNLGSEIANQGDIL